MAFLKSFRKGKATGCGSMASLGNRIWVMSVVLLLGILVSPSLTHAQSAQINGTVKDQSGAVLPNATVTVRNTQTNVSRRVETNSAGTYAVPNLAPGVYEVTIEKEHLRTAQFAAVSLTVDQALTLDVTLQLGEVSQSVTVTGETVAQVDTTDAQVSNVVDERQMKDLPLILRDPYQLILLTPGAVSTNSGLGGFSVNGARERNNNFMLDGADNNDPGVPASGLASLNPDATQEFRVITNNYQPEFGRNAGSIIDIVTKSGTNDLHGDAYWFGRYAAAGANDFFANASGLPRNPYTRNDFGASLGGPIRKDKTFFFGNYEGQRFATTTTNQATVPTAAFKNGIFTFNGQAYNVSTPGSKDNRFGLSLDPLVRKVLALYPAANGAKVDDVRGLFNFASPDHFSGDNYTVKVDHNLTSKHVISVRYNAGNSSDDNQSHLENLPGIGGVSASGLTQSLNGHLASTLSPNVLNDLRASGARSHQLFGCTGTKIIDSLGGTDQFRRGRDWNIPGIAPVACTALGDSNQQLRPFGTYNVGDNVTWILGRHATKFGIEFADEYTNDFDNFGSRSTPNFSNFSNFNVASTTRSLNDQILQDMVWGLFGAVGQETQAQFFNNAGTRLAGDARGFRERDFYAFWQDSFKLWPNFTLNYGLRYELNGTPFEVHNLVSTVTAAQLIGPAPVTFQTVGRGGNIPLYPTDLRGFEPRVGFAWDPFKTGKTSVRGGYGLFRDRLFFNLVGNTRSNPPLGQTFANSAFANLGPVAADQISNVPLPTSVTPVATIANFPAPTSLIFPGTLDTNLKVGYAQDWNFGIQRELPGNVQLEINYVGTKGDHLLRVVDGNPPNPAQIAALRAFCHTSKACTDTPTVSDVQGFNLYIGQQIGLFPFNAVNNSAFFHSNLTKSIASSIYHGLQTTVTRRFSHGLFIQGAYTYSHAIDDSGDPLAPQVHNLVFPANSFDLRQERGNSGFDTTHRLVVNYTAELPFGRGKPHLSGGFLGKALEGWALSGISTFASGTPFEIFTVKDSNGTGSTQRADFNPNGTPAAISPGGERTQTGPNIGLFSAPAFGRGGNLGRNVFRGPGINNWDMVLAKNTRVTERFGLEFRTEAYNVFNRVQFNQPGEFIENAGTFGQSTSEATRNDGTTAARQLQFALKLHF